VTTPNLRQRFVTAPPSPPAAADMEYIRENFAHLAEVVDTLAPDGREKALALTKLEEAKYFTNQAIILADNQNGAPE